MKDSLAFFSVPWFTFWRFAVGTAVLFPFLAKKTWRVMGPAMLMDAFVLGLLFCAGTLVQLEGVARTDAGRSAFINSTNIVTVPILQAALARRAPSLKTIAGSLLCFFGVAFLSMRRITEHSDPAAELLVFAGTLLFAVLIVTFKHMLKRNDPIILSFVQFAFVALMSLPVALFYSFPSLGSARGWVGILYAAVVMNIGVVMVMNNALNYISPANTMLISSNQALYATFFGALLLNEAVTWQLAVSGSAIFAGIVIGVFGAYSTSGAKTP